ncbi:MAG: hypothetical protein K6G75_11255 [Lachnospiraceae bacterium]|nr:hypothetical protein [Lachnospiraceae bacterium]
MENKKRSGSIVEYLNIAGTAAAVSFTLVQTVYAIMWFVSDAFAFGGKGGFSFHWKEAGSYIFMAAVIFFLTDTVVRKVTDIKVKPFYYIVFVVYTLTIPTVVSVNFNATLQAVCVSLLLLLLSFMLRYFYGRHELRLYYLIGIFAITLVLSYLNRAAFWTGVFESFVFLTIQLIRNINIRRKNIGDKSWRNTLLLFCILIIIMLIPQYCSYNNIKHTLYHQSLKEQLSARFLVPYIEYEKMKTDDEYLLGVIKNIDIDSGHTYRDFKKIMHRYEEDELDMETIWDNLYRNAYYRYRKNMAKEYLRDVVKNCMAPFVLKADMDSNKAETHHGYYYGLFSVDSPVLSDNYFEFGLWGMFVLGTVTVIQILILLIKDIVTGKYRSKIEEGKHRKVEAVMLIVCLSIACTAFQSMFSLKGSSYVSGIGSVIIWVTAAAYTCFSARSSETAETPKDN